MTGLKRAPLKPADKDINAFIDGAETRKDTPEQEEHPWESPEVRDDVLKLYNLRLPESYLLKLKYIAAHTPGSMQRFCLDALLPAIDEEIDRLTK
jgi:hypothetical protein